jgi:hypothetical protein
MLNTKKSIYTIAELVFAATARCECGAGIAYPRDAEPYGESAYWDCSAILTGKAVPTGEPGSVKHTDKLPFMFYEIKSEDQPSAQGRTTRPSEDDVAKQARRIAELRADIDRADSLNGHFAKKQQALDADKQRWRETKEKAIAELRSLGETVVVNEDGG